MENSLLMKVFNKFVGKGVKSISPLGKGNINYTYKVICEDGREYLLQKLNGNALPNIDACLHNIDVISEHIKAKGEVSLSLIKTSDGEVSYKDKEGFVWRLYPFFSGSVSVDETDDLELIEEIARGFGRFDNLLVDLDVKNVQVSDDNFHNTRQKYELLMKSIVEDSQNRVVEAIDEIEWTKRLVESCNDITGIEIFKLSDELFGGELAKQVVHNDTKLNNVLLNAVNKVLCVVDLDTAMPGTILNDFADGVRFACNSASEEEYDISKVSFDLVKFEAFTKGFFDGYQIKLSKREKELLAIAPISIAFELGCRFFADFLNGDVFFRIVSEDKKFNLVRARVQFKLCENMLDNFESMKNIVFKYIS
ncbi:MAG: aminoglycoside phosphotransferase family protein [Clostridia bacterium]|nr:aminoglycoside phosphotransferase family protein [Clostridia bacterium]